jgi:ATP-dependent DNA helicase RecQ
MAATDNAIDLERTLRDHFGLERFRPGQREVIEQVLHGRDTLCVMPTGGGKSLCYQLPALLLPGVTLVVSPLIALMKDQVDALEARGLRATLINSTLDPGEQRARMAEIEAGRFDLVYVAPERFRSPRFLAMIARVRPSLLAVDEAHCISEWGHDFRPDYARLGAARRQLGSPACIALTATATDAVRRDIILQLELHEPGLFITGFDRPNLHYGVIEAGRDEHKFAELTRALESHKGSSIVYASSRARCEDVADFIRTNLRREAVVYHAGLTREQRSGAQERFMRGEAEIVVATNAFGMGVDKADIRSVIHFNLPGTLEAYYQEAGRAGRDGLPALCLLLHSHADRFLQEHFIENEFPPRASIYRIYDFLRKHEDDPIQLTHAELREAARVEMNDSAVGSVLKILDECGAIEKFLPRENMAIVRFNLDQEEASRSLADRLAPQAHVQRVVLLALEALVRGQPGEAVYFRPDELAQTLGLERSALTRAIRALCDELPIDYIPPFRGNAIRVVDRNRKARDLSIDFDSLQKRKDHEYEKLERMVRYARSSQCRRSFILGYFGERNSPASACGGCDICRQDQRLPFAAPSSREITSEVGRETLLKILSGIARAKGRFGKVVVAQMLTGSSTERMKRWKLDRLSTYGILQHSGLTQRDVADLVDALVRAGMVESQDVDRFKQVIVLTDRGWQWLRGRGADAVSLELTDELLVKLDGRPAADLKFEMREGQPADSRPGESLEPPPDSPPESADPLRDRLRAMRTEWAREAGQPAYCVFSNETLEALVRERPTTPAKLGSIKGLGRARVERYGDSLLKAIAEHPGENKGSLPHEAPPSKGRVPTEEWTARLIDHGFSIDEAASIRRLGRAAIIAHLIECAKRGRTIAMDALLPADVLMHWQAWSEECGDTAPPDLIGVPFDLWPLFVASVRTPP